MSYAFKFDCWDKADENGDDEYGSTSRKNRIDATVVADSEPEALDKVKALVKRDKYKLEDVAELSELNTTASRW
jgi:hypothetical protein